MSDRLIYDFAAGEAAGDGDQKALLGGKGAGLAEMSRLGIPVPPGFTLTTEVCTWFHAHDGHYPDGLEAELERELERLEQRSDKRFGDPDRPLLVSVRSGAALSMPGMMDTVLNIGLNEEILEARIAAGWQPRFAWDCWRRLLSMYGDVVLGVPRSAFEQHLQECRASEGVATDAELSVDGLQRLASGYLQIMRDGDVEFPLEPRRQLWGAIDAVFRSWNNRRAREYRRLHGIGEGLGTAVNVQAMVFGNAGDDCATGVAFTRSPADGTPGIYGEFLVNAQGEDVVAGIRTPRPIVSDGSGEGLDHAFPDAFGELVEVCRRLEEHRRDMQDVEFTIEHGRLYMLQTRTGKRTGPAAVRIACDFVEEGRITPEEALRRVTPEQLTQLLAPGFDPERKEQAIDEGRLLARGLAAGPGAATGRIALTAERAEEMAASGPVVLVREETSPEDIVGMHAATGILTARGGMTSHAAVVARGMGKPCVVGAGVLRIDEESGEIRAADRTLEEGDEISIDGTTGEVIAGRLEPRPSVVLASLEGDAAGEANSSLVEAFRGLLAWADERRRLGVRANADTPRDARVARLLGAGGIGLCRTEHMFFDEERIGRVRRLILADDEEERERVLAELLPVQQQDFEEIFEALDGLPVTIRLLDPPLHEFLPREDGAIRSLAAQMGLEPAEVRGRVETLSESNPMLGHRGCRLGLTFPAIYRMQVEAVGRAVLATGRAGVRSRPEIMVPLVGSEREMIELRRMIEEVLVELRRESGEELTIPIGTMIEVPRAALVADRIAAAADFFSFGTNDLTQLTFGFSRDDAGRFLPQYVEHGILPADPFVELDRQGVGELVKLAVERGRAARPDLKVGICGEHGGEPRSVTFFDGCGLDYVSCSPYRVPAARLAAARAALGADEIGDDV